MRNPISVSTTNNIIIAICDDGSIWELFKDKWHRLPEIPQEDEQNFPQMLIEQNG